MKTLTKIILSLTVLSSMLTAQVLVTVNGTEITQTEVENELMQATQGRFNQVPADKQMEFRKQVLNQLVAKELIYSDAKKSGILKSPEFKNKYEEVIKRIKKEIAIQVWQKRAVDNIKVTQKELKDYYTKNREEFFEKERVHARHILVDSKKEADAIVKQLKKLKGVALKTKFIELAKAKSTGPSAIKGGDLGYFAKEEMVPEFSAKAFSMKAETVSNPVKTKFGFHVIYLEDKKLQSTKSFNEVKLLIEQRLKMEKAKSVIMKKMTALEKSAIIKQ